MIFKRRVLVTGGTGFIGQVLIQRLQETAEVDEIIIITRNPGKAATLFPISAKLRLLKVELGHPLPAELFREPIDVVFHLAGLKLDPDRPLPDSAYHHLNHDAALTLARAAALAGTARFIFFSSTGVYGTAHRCLLDEASACHPGNIYERTKLAAEQSLEEFSASTPMKIIVLRPSNVFGPSHPRQHLLTLMRTIKQRRLILPLRDGWANYVAVEDLADAALRLGFQSAVQTGVRFQRFIANCPMRVGDLVGEIAAVLATPPQFPRLPNSVLHAIGFAADTAAIIIRRRLPVSRRKIQELSQPACYVSDRLKTELAAWPSTGIQTALHNTARHYQAGGFL